MIHDVETRVEVIEAGPWTFDNRSLIVKPWTINANLEREDMKVEYERIPVSCKGCGVFGNTDARCPKKPEVLQQWVIKKPDTDSGIGREEEGINITGTRGSPQRVHGDTTKGKTSVVCVADKRTAEPALEFIDEGEVNCPKALDKGHKNKKKSPNGGGSRANNSKEFRTILQESWLEGCEGTKMYQLYMRSKRLKPKLKALNTKHYSNISTRVMQAKSELHEVQRTIQLGNVTDAIRDKELECKMVYATLCKDDEAFYKQKSRVKWLDVGDKNTAYFFKKVTGYKVRNKVMSINALEGVWREECS
ncbi:hypothetical protein LguiB_026637 [Lonicera macranthoides]